MYGSLFLVSGAVLLAITYVLVSHSSGDLVLFKEKLGPEREQILRELDAATGAPVPQVLKVRVEELRQVADKRDEELLSQLIVQSGIALAIMSVASIGLGWWIAGRVLAPLRTMISTTQRISHENLHQRLALSGPDDELKALADTIDDLLARLEAAFEAQGRFVANAAHELRTPMAMMRTSLDVAVGKPKPVPAEVTHLDEKVREGLDQADRLLDGLLILSRAEYGALGPRASVSLGSIASEAIETQRESIAERRIEVRQATDGVRVMGNETLLSRMVANVVDNAVRHNQKDGWIEVRSWRNGDLAALLVESDGSPLDPEQVADLAQPFRRLGAERTGSEEGVGLGLSIVTAIALAHGGGVVLTARKEGGLRVTIELPSRG